MSYVAIGNDELGEPLGRQIKCPHCGSMHDVMDSEPSTIYHGDGTTSKGDAGLLQFYRCDSKTYLAGINHKAWKQ